MAFMFPAPRILFRAGVYAAAALLVGAVYWVYPTHNLYAAVLVLGYLSAHTLVAKTLALWIDRLYFATLGREQAQERLEKFARKSENDARKAARAETNPLPVE
jgi:hypothetical protein